MGKPGRGRAPGFSDYTPLLIRLACRRKYRRYTLFVHAREAPRPLRDSQMSENDPWQRWYQEPPPSDSASASADRTVSMSPSSQPTFQPKPWSGAGGAGGAGATARSGAGGGGWGTQPPLISPPGAPPVTPGRGGRGRGRRWRFWGQPGRHGRRIALIIGVVIVLVIAGTAGTYFWIDGKLNKTVSLPAFSGTSAGTNWLIAGSDQRTGISRSEQDRAAPGLGGGRRVRLADAAAHGYGQAGADQHPP